MDNFSIRRNFSRGFIALMACMACTSFAVAQSYPSKSIKIVVPYPPGNASDTMSRIVGDQLFKRLGQPVIVDNKPGASGGIGAQAVARAAPDGYTLLMTSTSFTINTALTKKLMYDVEKDFEPVAMISTGGGMVLLVPTDAPFNSVAELVDAMKKSPGKLNYAHAGRGTIQHLTMESFLAATGTKATEVGYKGSVQGLTDLASRQVDVMFDAQGSSQAFVQGGRLKILAVSSEKRSPNYPQVPTAAESGIPSLKDWSVTGWVALLAPAKTPRPILEQLNREVIEILKMPEVKERASGQKMQAFEPYNVDRTREFLRADMKNWQSAAGAAKLEEE